MEENLHYRQLRPEQCHTSRPRCGYLRRVLKNIDNFIVTTKSNSQSSAKLPYDIDICPAF